MNKSYKFIEISEENMRIIAVDAIMQIKCKGCKVVVVLANKESIVFQFNSMDAALKLTHFLMSDKTDIKLKELQEVI